ncbi:FkbM family methyltransferase [Methylobacterium dankookense]|uniref:Methyltransferase FkbM domain-containing protein n=1 Tax=Methylobacterium dankookense TaxID=560405 RepID=A0A564G490_9HYPH|nr:FkbM family methyltransferase [Methylobacterium dankookense]GJD58166.1 hypothetical protein IFDJLNFL_4081 [Methylobacterium dankookense]VUF15117.1 hypothetical protein MTDSW087_04850 [Methylobacterium dankookense]
MSDLQLKEHTFIVGDKHFSISNDAADSLLAGSLGDENTWEPWQLKLYARLVHADSICLDVGGNIGTSAIAMAHYAQNGHVYTFEPVKRTFSILSLNLRNNKVENVTPSNIGISNEVGEATIRVDRSLLGNARRVDDATAASDELHYNETFKMQPLDTWMSENNIKRADLIKVDVEGFELEVIEGGQKAFFGDERTVSIFEFGIEPQRQARPRKDRETPRDVSFFLKLKTAFKYIFLIGRDEKLYPVKDYAQLRFMMLAGYPVEDLLCCHIVPSSIKDLISPNFIMSPIIPETGIIPTDGNGIVVAYNRGSDGWSFPSPHSSGTRSSYVVSLSKPASLRVELNSVNSKASRLSSCVAILVVGDREYCVDVLDRSVSLDLHLPAGVTHLFVETDSVLHSADYFGNPGDQRQIGVRLNLPDFEATL